MKKIHVLMIGFLIMLITGCGVERRDPSHVQYYLLNVERSSSEVLSTKDVCLRVRSCRVGESFAGRSLIYRTGPVRYEPDYYNLFLTKPENQITDILRNWFRQTGIRDCGLVQETQLGKYTLEPYIEILCSDFTNPRKPVAIVQMHVLMTHYDKDCSCIKVLLEKTFILETPLPENPSAAQIVEGLSTSLTDILQQLEEKVVKLIK